MIQTDTEEQLAFLLLEADKVPLEVLADFLEENGDELLLEQHGRCSFRDAVPQSTILWITIEKERAIIRLTGNAGTVLIVAYRVSNPHDEITNHVFALIGFRR